MKLKIYILKQMWQLAIQICTKSNSSSKYLEKLLKKASAVHVTSGKIYGYRVAVLHIWDSEMQISPELPHLHSKNLPEV